jgi:hypothetical protein
MALPLVIRKNIRDSEPKLHEHLAIINEATGKEWAFEADWAAIVGQLEANQKDTIGQLYHNDVMGNLARNIAKLVKTETTKEAFLEATSSNKIVIKLNDKIKDYWDISFSNGDLVVTHKKSICNLANIEYFDIVAVIPTPGLPLAVKLNIEQNQPLLEEIMERIAAATGVADWTFEADYPSIVPQLDRNSQNRIGDIYKDILHYFASNLTRSLKNEVLKEAFVEAVSERKIEIRLNDKQKDYTDINFVNGTIVISHKKMLANLNNFEYQDLAPKIPAPGIPLVTKINLAETRNQEALQTALEKLNTATGADDWSFEADFQSILPQLDKNSQDRIGDIYYQSALDSLAKCVENKLKIETTKEAFNEATPNHKVIFRVNDKQRDYWDVKFENGNLVTEHKKSIANINQLEYFALEDIIPTPGLPLVVKLNIEEYKPKEAESLERIAEATGAGDWVFEVDFDAIVPQLDPNTGKTIGRLYYQDCLPLLANNIKSKLSKSETLKEAFNEATSERKIVFRVVDKQAKYWDIVFQNGSLVVSHKKQIANVNDLEYFPLQDIIPVPGVLSLVAKLNVEESRPKLEEHLQVISTATGQEYTFDDSCLETFYPKLAANYQARIGSLFLDEVMHCLANNLQKSLKDEMVLEAFNEMTSAHQITFRAVDKLANYWDISLKDGLVILSFNPNISNVANIEYFNIERLL